MEGNTGGGAYTSWGARGIVSMGYRELQTET